MKEIIEAEGYRSKCIDAMIEARKRLLGFLEVGQYTIKNKTDVENIKRALADALNVAEKNLTDSVMLVDIARNPTHPDHVWWVTAFAISGPQEGNHFALAGPFERPFSAVLAKTAVQQAFARDFPSEYLWSNVSVASAFPSGGFLTMYLCNGDPCDAAAWYLSLVSVDR